MQNTLDFWEKVGAKILLDITGDALGTKTNVLVDITPVLVTLHNAGLHNYISLLDITTRQRNLT